MDRIGAAMLVALVFALPIGFAEAAPAVTSPLLLLAGIGVGVSSSVIPSGISRPITTLGSALVKLG